MSGATGPRTRRRMRNRPRGSEPMSEALRRDDPLVLGLAAAATTPGLQTVLLFGAGHDGLQVAATTLQSMLAAVYAQPVTRVTLGSVEADDVLWGTMVLTGDAVGPPVTWWAGLLGDRPDEPGPRLVLIPDLARL